MMGMAEIPAFAGMTNNPVCATNAFASITLAL